MSVPLPRSKNERRSFLIKRWLIVIVPLSLLAAGAVIGDFYAPEPKWKTIDLAPDGQLAQSGFRHLHAVRGVRGFDCMVARFDRERTIAQLVDVPAGATLGDVAGEAALTINGGYFDAGFHPLGLYRIDGHERSPALVRSPLSGFVTIDAWKRLSLSKTDEPAGISAFQAGPFLIEPGGALGIHADDGRIAERTILAMGDASFVVIVTSPASLRSVAEWLHDQSLAIGVSRIERAINLDGGPSSGYVIQSSNGRTALPPRGPVRSALRFQPRSD